MSEDFRYQIRGGEATVTAYLGDGGEVTIPAELGGAPVRVVGSYAFHDNGFSVTKITVPGNVRKILPHAFELCVQMRELILEEGVEELGEDFLAGTDVRELLIPASVRRIRGAAQLPAKIIVAEDNPYYESDGCGLYFLPDGRMAAHGAATEKREAAGHAAAGHTTDAEDGCIPSCTTGAEDGRIPTRMIGTEDGRMQPRTVGAESDRISRRILVAVDPTSTCSSYAVLPGTTEIAMGVFDDRPSLREASIPETVTKIADGALANIRNPYSLGAGLARVFVDPANPVYYHDSQGVFERLPEGGLRVIRWLSPAEEIDLGDGMIEIGAAAFSRGHIHRISVPKETRRIAPDAFFGCPLREFSVRGTEICALFPEDNLYLQKDLLRGFGRNGRLYDFAAYDAKLAEWFPDLSRIEMILMRLVSPHELDERTRERYARTLTEHLPDVVAMIGNRRSMYALRLLTKSGLLDENGASAAISWLNAAGRAEMTAYLMAFKRSHFSKKEFDFSL